MCRLLTSCLIVWYDIPSGTTIQVSVIASDNVYLMHTSVQHYLTLAAQCMSHCKQKLQTLSDVRTFVFTITQTG